MDKDYYNILGISKGTPKDEIKKAYRKLAHKHHPDKKGGSESKFKEINEAYYVLGDDKRRSEYDRYGRVFNGAGGQQTGGFGGFDFSGFNGSGNMSDFSEIFGDIFGFSGTHGQARRRGRDISIDLELSFEESVFGVNRKIILTKIGTCDGCGGSMGTPDSVMKTCTTCQGTGRIHETKRSFLGTFTATKTCDGCNGAGKIPSKKCKKCRGAGVIKGPDEISIEIPSGIYNGEVIKMTGRGEAISNGIAGDLYIKIHVGAHKVFKREGDNLTMDLSIPLSEALLGGERTIKIFGHNLKVKIPQGVNYGEILRIKGRGIPHKGGGKGDLMIKVLVKIPRNLSRKAKKLVEELREEGV
ncbi:molecular chaperone DnaJ [Patescibacteria group bacterium]